MGNRDHRILAIHRLDRGLHLLLQIRIQIARRLVEDQHIGIRQ